MPADFDTGMFVREPAWHGLGNVVDDYPGTWAEARVLAGLDWEPVESGVYDATELYADGTAKVELIEGYKQLKRNDNGTRLHIAKGSYEIIDHEAMGQIVDAIMTVGKPLGIKYETAGSLDGGRRVWALARLGDYFDLPGDPSPYGQYMALLNSHDGSAALKAIETDVRIVCANTWHAAETSAEHSGAAYSFRHTKNWREQVEQAKTALANAVIQHEATVAAAKEMLAQKITKAQRDAFIHEFTMYRTIATTVGKTRFTKSQLEERMAQPRVLASIEQTVNSLNGILGSQTSDGIRDTMYGLVQAAGEFADWGRTSANPETLFTRTVLAVEPLKLEAVKIAGKVLQTA